MSGTEREEKALQEWRSAIGNAHVIVEPEPLKAAERATFATTQRVRAILRPGNREELQRCVRVAAEFNMPVYPVSRGRNWGLGSRVPTTSGCVIVDLQRLNRIVDFSEELSYISVEPGVTFEQVSTFLREKKSKLFLATTGGPPDASLVGNALERGDGLGRLGERNAQICALEVVTGTGELLQTGFGGYPDASAAHLVRAGVGPLVDSVFGQSNYGIVAQMTFWLARQPTCFQPFVITVKHEAKLVAALEAVRELQAAGVLHPNSFALWNWYKALASVSRYPWKSTNGEVPLTETHRPMLPPVPWGSANWVGVGALYSASPAHARADRRLLKKALAGKADQVFVLTKRSAKLISVFRRPIDLLFRFPVSNFVRLLWDNSVFLGNPTTHSLNTAYWRKKGELPAVMDPDRDGCGLIWACPAFPFRPVDVMRCLSITEEVCLRHGFEPSTAIIFPSERVAFAFPSIIYDRHIAGEDEKAMACHDELLRKLVDAGYYPYRLGVQSMQGLGPRHGTYQQFLTSIKAAIDPAGIIAPGRYEKGQV